MIVADKTLPSGQLLTHHQIMGRSVDMGALLATVTVGSWPSDDLSVSPAVTQKFPIQLASWDPDYLDDLEARLLDLPTWQDWNTLPPSKTLEEARAEKWAEMKRRRSELEFGGFAWEGVVFDSDAISVQKISSAVQLAVLAQMAGQPFDIDFTVADNSVVTLDASQMIAVGLALGTHVQAVYARGRVKRAAIEAAPTVAEVDAIAWED